MSQQEPQLPNTKNSLDDFQIPDLNVPQSAQPRTNALDRIMKIAMLVGLVALLGLIVAYFFVQKQPDTTVPAPVPKPAAPKSVEPTPDVSAPPPFPDSATPAATNTGSTSTTAVENSATETKANTTEANTPAAANTSNVTATKPAEPVKPKVNPVSNLDTTKLTGQDGAVLKEVLDRKVSEEQSYTDQKKLLQKQIDVSDKLIKTQDQQIVELQKQLDLLQKQNTGK